MKKKGFLGRLLSKEGEGEGLGELSGDKREMIRGVVELSEKTVKEVMVPRVDLVCVAEDASAEEILEVASGSGHSRIPVYKDTVDSVVGILHVKDLLRALVRKEAFEIGKLIRKPYFVPESKRLDGLLREFKRRHTHVAVVVDEYGGVSGIVCFEDVLEEIVGDIQDEFDDEREDVVRLGEGAWLCDARVNIGDLNEELGLALPDQDYDTLGGFVFDLFGKIPVKYEKIGYHDLDFIVHDMDGHKINAVKLIRKKERAQ